MFPLLLLLLLLLLALAFNAPVLPPALALSCFRRAVNKASNSCISCSSICLASEFRSWSSVEGTAASSLPLLLLLLLLLAVMAPVVDRLAAVVDVLPIVVLVLACVLWRCVGGG